MECPICLGPLNRCPDGIEDNVRRRLTKIRTATCCCTPCGHIFHKACLLTWLDQGSRPPCPVCNVKLSKMKLYPAYLNTDKDREARGMIAGGSVGVKQNVSTSSWTGSGAGSVHSTATATVTLPSATVPYLKPGHSQDGATSQAVVGTSAKLSSITPGGGSGLATTMTIGAYALTTFGPLPLVPASALGAPPGATVPRSHPQLGGNFDVGTTSSSAFVAFPQAVPIAMSSTSTVTSSEGRGRVETNATWNRVSARNNTDVNTAASLQQQHPLPRRVPSGTSTCTSTGAQPGIMWPWDFSGDSGYTAGNTPAGGTSSNTHLQGEVSGQQRYSPYRQPPPAHATSSSHPRRITNIFDGPARPPPAGRFTNIPANNSGNSSIDDCAAFNAAGDNGRNNRGSGAPPRMYVHTPNVHEFQVRTQP